MTPAFHDNEGPPGVGFFTYNVLDDRWSWSEGMYLIHGYEADEVFPSTELLLEHEHPEDRPGVQEALDIAARTGALFSCYHRIIARLGRVQSVLTVGHGIYDQHGFVERVEGFYVDIAALPGPPSRRHRSDAVEAALGDLDGHRRALDAEVRGQPG
jgi:hypothetical protein